MVAQRDVTLGAERTMQLAVDMLYNCTLETYMVLLTNSISRNSIKNVITINSEFIL